MFGPTIRKTEFIHYMGGVLAHGGPFKDGPELDFIKDALMDDSFKNFQTWGELLDYLESRGAIKKAIKAARIVFEAWEKRQEWVERNWPKE
jgi:hypothetical protein